MSLTILPIQDGADPRLLSFLQQPHPPAFRYWSRGSRDPIATVRDAHVLTLIGMVNDKVAAYAHIDHDKETNLDWVGLCVLPDFQRRGYGTAMLNCIFEYHRTHLYGIPLYLTVDLNNTGAICLYERAGFVPMTVQATYQIMRYDSGHS
jgi:ribosomal protein S18 acetylase RimI-like enzyme